TARAQQQNMVLTEAPEAPRILPRRMVTNPEGPWLRGRILYTYPLCKTHRDVYFRMEGTALAETIPDMEKGCEQA
ncbi:MAG: hypothetical protein AAGI70_13355, partial [Pseudomonadota bacterium]